VFLWRFKKSAIVQMKELAQYLSENKFVVLQKEETNDYVYRLLSLEEEGLFIDVSIYYVFRKKNFIVEIIVTKMEENYVKIETYSNLKEVATAMDILDTILLLKDK